MAFRIGVTFLMVLLIGVMFSVRADPGKVVGIVFGFAVVVTIAAVIDHRRSGDN